MQIREHGQITTYQNERGFGFIRPYNGGEDVFFHVTRCSIPEGELRSGMQVEFTLVPDRKQPGRYRAIEVTAAEEVN